MNGSSRATRGASKLHSDMPLSARPQMCHRKGKSLWHADQYGDLDDEDEFRALLRWDDDTKKRKLAAIWREGETHRTDARCGDCLL